MFSLLPFGTNNRTLSPQEVVDEAIKQLTALGYKKGDRIWVRLIAPKKLPLEVAQKRGMTYTNKKGEVLPVPITGYLNWVSNNGFTFTRMKKKRDEKGEVCKNEKGQPVWGEGRTEWIGLNYLLKQNKKGYGVYLVVNPGGQTDEEITGCHFLFYECDGVPKAEQWERLHQLEAELNKPASLVVETRNSLHAYLEDEAILPPDEWRIKQQRLIQKQQSDRSIHNPARLMRLAGYDHWKWNEQEQKLENTPVRIVQLQDSIVSQGEWESVLPEWDATMWNDVSGDGKSKSGNGRTLYEGEPWDGDTDSIVWAQYLYGYNPYGRDGWITAQDPTIPESERHNHSIDSLHINKESGAIMCHRDPSKEHRQKVYELMREIATNAIWHELTKLPEVVTKRFNTSHIDLEALNLPRGEINVIISAKGTNKTNALTPFVKHFKNSIAWFSRIALGREECERIGYTWRTDLGKYQGELKVGTCVESAPFFSAALLADNGLALGDEFDQLCAQMFGQTANAHGKRPMILAAFKAQVESAIAGNGMALFMSADISQSEVQFLKDLFPDIPINVYLNEYKPQRGKIRFYQDPEPYALIDQLVEDLRRGEAIYLIDDMKNGVRGCKTIADYVKQVAPDIASRITEINSDTSGAPEIIGYLKDINKASLRTSLLCCSPSVVSGVSIQNGHFKKVYAFFNGILTVNNASQAIARPRGCQEFHVWAAEQGVAWCADRSLFPKQINDYYQRNYQQNAKYLSSYNAEYKPLEQEWTSPFWRLFCRHAAYRNLCMANLRKRLYERFVEEGYELEECELGESKITSKAMVATWGGIEYRHALAVANARILTETEMEALKDAVQTPEDKLDIEKTILYHSYGEDMINAMEFHHEVYGKLTGYAAMVYRDAQGYRQKLQAFYYLMRDESEAISRDLKAEFEQIEWGAGRFAGDVRWNARKRKCREYLGLRDIIEKYGESGEWFAPLAYAELCKKARKYPKRVKDSLNFTVSPKVYDGQIIGELMEQVGLALDKDWAPDKTADGRSYKLRRIDRRDWHYANMYCQYRDKLKAQAVAVDHPLPQFINKLVGGGDQAQKLTQQQIEPSQLPHFLPKEIPLPDTALDSRSGGEILEEAGFKVGQKVMIAVDQYDKATQREIARNNEAPVGKIVEIVRFELNQAAAKFGRRQVDAIVESEGTRYKVPMTYLRIIAGQKRDVPPHNPIPNPVAIPNPSLSVGTLAKWGSRLGDWVVESIEGSVAKVRQASGWATQFLWETPIDQLRPIEEVSAS